MTIYEIKRQSLEHSPLYFSTRTLKFFGQTMKSFSVVKQSDGRYKISAPITDRFTGRNCGQSVRYFNPTTKKLDFN